jgi:hypothetical protein
MAIAAPHSTPLDDAVRTIIALVVGVGGAALIIAFWVYRSSTDAQAVSSVMTGLMGGVLGYYFGASQKSKSDVAADTANAKADKAKTAAGKALAKVAEAKGKLKVIAGGAGGGLKVRSAPPGGSATPEDDALADLEQAASHLAEL